LTPDVLTIEGRFDWGRYDFGTFRRRDVLTMGRFDCKAAEPIEIPFGLRTRVSRRNHMLEGVRITPWKWAIWRGKGRLILKYMVRSAVSSAKTAEPIEMPFRKLSRMDQRTMH